MLRVFISYSRADLTRVEGFHDALARRGVAVWRDQEDLYGGDAWPKALGDAVAEQDVFLLCWSAEAQRSRFVELEWTTALALQKPIIPCLLDDTPLPPSLRARHGIPLADAEHAASATVAAIARAGGSTSGAQDPEVLQRLASVGAARDPAHVLEAVQTVVDRRKQDAQGGAPDGGEGGEDPGPKPKSLVEKWQLWVALLAGVVTLLGSTFDLWGKVWGVLGGGGDGPHVVSLMPGVALAYELPKPGDPAGTTYSLQLVAGDDTVTIPDFRRRIYLTGASERSLRERATQAAATGLYESIDRYAEENQIPPEESFLTSMRQEQVLFPSAPITDDAALRAVVYRHPPGEPPIRLPVRPVVRRNGRNVTTVILESEQP